MSNNEQHHEWKHRWRLGLYQSVSMCGVVMWKWSTCEFFADLWTRWIADPSSGARTTQLILFHQYLHHTSSFIMENDSLWVNGTGSICIEMTTGIPPWIINNLLPSVVTANIGMKGEELVQKSGPCSRESNHKDGALDRNWLELGVAFDVIYEFKSLTHARKQDKC